MFFFICVLLVFIPDLGKKRVTFDLNLWEESYENVEIHLDSEGDFWKNRTYSVKFSPSRKKNIQLESSPRENRKIYTEFRSPDGKRTGIRMVCSSGSMCWFISFQGGLLHQITKFHRSGFSVHRKEPWQTIQFDSKARIQYIETKILSVLTKKQYIYNGESLKRIDFLVGGKIVVQEKISRQGKNQVQRQIFQRNYVTGEFESKGSIVIKTAQDGEEHYFYYGAQGDLIQFKKVDKQDNRPMRMRDSLDQEYFYRYPFFYSTRQDQVEFTDKVESITSINELLLDEESWDFEPFSECSIRECTTSGGEKVRFSSPSYEYWINTWGGDEREKTILHTPTSVEEIYKDHKKIFKYEDDAKSTTFKRFFYPFNIPYGTSTTIWSKDGLPLEEIYGKSRNLYFYGDRDLLENHFHNDLERVLSLDRVGIYEMLQQFLEEKPYPKEKIEPFLIHLKKFVQVNHKKRIFLDENGRVIRYSRWETENQKDPFSNSAVSLSVKFYTGAPNLKYYKSRSILDFIEDGILLTKVDVISSQNTSLLYGGWNEFLTQSEDMVDPELENLSAKVFLRINANILEELSITQYTSDGLVYTEKKVTRKDGIKYGKGNSNTVVSRENGLIDEFFSSFEDTSEARVQSEGL